MRQILIKCLHRENQLLPKYTTNQASLRDRNSPSTCTSNLVQSQICTIYHNRIQNTRLYDYILTIINWPKDLEKTSRNLSLELWTNEIDSVWKLQKMVGKTPFAWKKKVACILSLEQWSIESILIAMEFFGYEIELQKITLNKENYWVKKLSNTNLSKNLSNISPLSELHISSM